MAADSAITLALVDMTWYIMALFVLINKKKYFVKSSCENHYSISRVPTKISEKNLGKKNKNIGKFIKKSCPLEGVREKLN